MIERMPAEPEDVFGEIEKNLRRDMHDPHGDEVKSLVDAVQGILDDEGLMTIKTAYGMAAMINEKLGSIRGKMVYVTGKGRLYTEDDNYLLEDSSAPEFAAFQPGITEHVDEVGPFYPLAHQACRFDFISVLPVDGEYDPDEDGPVAKYRATYQFSILTEDSDDDDDYEDARLDISIDATELDFIAPMNPSLLKRELDLINNYPEIAAQLGDLPADILDDKDGIAALKKFRLKVDTTKYPFNRPDRLHEIISTIGDIIMGRFVADENLYKIKFQGDILGISASGEYASFSQDERDDLYGSINDCMLLKIGDEEAEGEVEYEVALVVAAPADGYYSGDYQLAVPARSVYKLKSLRNRALFSEKMDLISSEFSQDGDFVPVNSGDSDVFWPESEDDPLESHEIIESQPDVEQPQAKQLNEKELSQFLKNFNELWAASRGYYAQVFKDRDEAVEAHKALQDILMQFFKDNQDMLTTELEFSGPCVEYVEALPGIGDILKQETMPQIDFSKVTVLQGDAMSVRRGRFTGQLQVVLKPQENEEGVTYTLTPFMFFNDKTGGASFAVRPNEAEFDMPIYNVSINTQFVIRLSQEGSVEAPTLTRIHRYTEAIGKIATQVPELTFLPEYLSDVKDAVDSEDSDDYIDISTEPLKAISELIGGNEQVTSLTADALTAIIGQRPVDISGAAYDKEGIMSNDSRMKGRLMGVIDSAPQSKAAEPMFVIDGVDGETHYFPLSQVNRFQL